MGYKLIALDIDGTIRSNEYPLSDRTRDVMDRVREAGASVTLATGRIYQSAVRASAELDIQTPIATSQGAHIANPVAGDVLSHITLTEQMTRDALNALEGSGMEVVGYYPSGVYVAEMTEWAEAYGQRVARYFWVDPFGGGRTVFRYRADDRRGRTRAYSCRGRRRHLCWSYTHAQHVQELRRELP